MTTYKMTKHQKPTDTKTLFLKLLGSYPRIKILDYALDNLSIPFTIADLYTNVSISRASAYNIIKEFMSLGVIIRAGSHDRSRLYILDKNNRLTRALLVLDLECARILGPLDSTEATNKDYIDRVYPGVIKSDSQSHAQSPTNAAAQPVISPPKRMIQSPQAITSLPVIQTAKQPVLQSIRKPDGTIERIPIEQVQTSKNMNRTVKPGEITLEMSG